VPLAAGGALDAIGRVLAERMKGSLGRPIIVENASGADGNIGVGRAARAKPDGYTLTLGSVSTHVLNGAFYSLPYDVLNDFAPVSPLVTTPAVLFAKKTMPANDLNELIVWLKANPNKASAGVITASFRLLTAFFQRETGTHFALVPAARRQVCRTPLWAGQRVSFGHCGRAPRGHEGAESQNANAERPTQGPAVQIADTGRQDEGERGTVAANVPKAKSRRNPA
jgi:tripartite-type tricarboxylate transporter receptor subunit TctC